MIKVISILDKESSHRTYGVIAIASILTNLGAISECQFCSRFSVFIYQINMRLIGGTTELIGKSCHQ